MKGGNIVPKRKKGRSNGKIIAVFLIIAVIGYISYHDGLFGVTPINKITDAMAEQDVRIKGKVIEVQASLNVFRISDGSSSIWVKWELDLPAVNSTVVVTGVVKAQNIVITVLWIEATSITPVWIFK